MNILGLYARADFNPIIEVGDDPAPRLESGDDLGRQSVAMSGIDAAPACPAVSCGEDRSFTLMVEQRNRWHLRHLRGRPEDNVRLDPVTIAKKPPCLPR